MKSLFVTLIVGMLCTGCTVPAPEPSKSLLDEADAKMLAEDYTGASASYGEFVKADPGNAQAARARATQTALDRLLDSQTELDRLKAQSAKLRADLERLRNIDLQTLPGIKK